MLLKTCANTNQLIQKVKYLLALTLITALHLSAQPAGKPVSGAEESSKVYSNQTFANQNLSLLLRQAGGGQYLRLEFQRCNFQGITNLSALPNAYHGFPASLIFRDCIFEGTLNLQSATFAGQVDFGKCQFKQELIIRNSVFMAPMAFRECGFEGVAGFQNCIFMKENNWTGSFFYQDVHFENSRFMKPPVFQNVQFRATGDFVKCRLEEGAVFDYCIAIGKLDFTQSRQDGPLIFRKGSMQKGISMNKFRSFAPLIMQETRFEDSLQLQDFRYFAEKPELLNLQGNAAPKAGF